jgi:hypothetical protein
MTAIIPIAAALLFTPSHQLLPDSAPAAHGAPPAITWAYNYFTPSTDGRYVFRCHVPPTGPRVCKVVR